MQALTVKAFFYLTEYLTFLTFLLATALFLKINQILHLYLVIILFLREISIRQTVIFILWYIVLYSCAVLFFKNLLGLIHFFRRRPELPCLVILLFLATLIGKFRFRFWLTYFVLQKNSGILRNSIASRKVYSILKITVGQPSLIVIIGFVTAEKLRSQHDRQGWWKIPCRKTSTIGFQKKRNLELIILIRLRNLNMAGKMQMFTKQISLRWISKTHYILLF